MVDKFGEPKYRPFRAGIFIAFGLSGAIPAVHYACYGRLGKRRLLRLSRMADSNGSTYILGALLSCIPECYFPGKCDIWFQSHKIFHVLVIAAAFVHYQGISEMAVYRLTNNQWLPKLVKLQSAENKRKKERKKIPLLFHPFIPCCFVY
ncbi:adiponectin receptor protein-like [Daphnia pulicaria]|uniref:adiponectin receptor protein-like n=1 Tax=Daphnia pulicaria TaxID=35523 RepID=UPI001EEBB8BB|nr:adiponectin receptor protein-like [Daphnia pulicaria]XP_046653205.1 adiponectin receptor protein-like [Daphnia pulicaria]